jgi:DNA-binding GntR family transcriptional regulator
LKGFQPDPTATKAPTDLAARRTYNELRRRIVTGQLAQGDIVNEVAMAAELKVSRTPMREVFRELLSEGLLVGDGPRRQVRVRSVSPDLLDEMFDVRLALEPLAAQAATTNASAEDVDALRLITARLADATKSRETPRFLDVDEEYHVALAHIARATVTEDFLRRLRALTRLALVTSSPSARLMLRTHDSRSDLTVAVAEADASAATAAVVNYLELARTWIRSHRNT